MQAYSLTAQNQSQYACQWTGLRDFNNRVKALIIQYVVLNACEKDLQPLFIDGACGRGGDIQKWESSAAIAKQEVMVWGIDVADGAVKEANRRVAESRLQHLRYCALTGDLQLYGGETDRALAGITLHFCINYMWTPELDSVLHFMFRSLGQGGMISVIFTNYDNLNSCAPFDMVTLTSEDKYRFNLGGLVNGVPEYKISLLQLVERFEKQGFRTVHAWPTLADASKHLACISRFLKPPKPMTRVEMNVAKCYGACVFVVPEK